MRLFSCLLVASCTMSMMMGCVYFYIYGPVTINIDKIFSVRDMVGALLVLPFLETVALQWAIIELFMFIGSRMKCLQGRHIPLVAGVSASALVFAALHFVLNDDFNGLVYGISGGITLSLIYAANRNMGRQIAFFSAWMLHVASNGLMLLSLYYFRTILQ